MLQMFSFREICQSSYLLQNEKQNLFNSEKLKNRACNQENTSARQPITELDGVSI